MNLRAYAATVTALCIAGLAHAQVPVPRPGATTPVQVMNGATNPVPVSVSNLPSTQTVTGTVNVGNFPSSQSVNVANTPNVNVVNTALPIVERAQKAVNHTFICASTAVGCGEGALTTYQVPTGFRLVIDYASINASNLPAGDVALLTIATTVDGVSAEFTLSAPSVALSGRSAQGQTVKLYADAGTNVLLSGDRLSGVGGGPNTSYFVSFTGHLAPLP